MWFRSIASRIAKIYTDLGARDGSLYFVNSALMLLSWGRIHLHKYYFISQPVRHEPRLSRGRGASIEVREIRDSDPILQEISRPAGVVPHRLSQGAVCLAALKNGRLAGFLWFVIGPYREDLEACRYVPLPEAMASWDFDVYINPEHRNSLVFLRLWDEADRYLAARGVRWSLSRISAFNANSMTAHRRLGASRLGSATFLFIGSLQMSVATVRPRIFLSRHRDQIPTFLLVAERSTKRARDQVASQSISR
jgi:hypothetical protein